jgi:glycosyltransferase involved in cell wall biosynthesis
MRQPWLSVIMPTYNGEVFLPTALNSILAQRDDHIEVIAVDDGSTDATVQILKFFATKIPLRIIQRGHIGNWVANTNHGLSLAQGNFVCFLHQDDHWLDTRICVLKPLLEQDYSITMLLHPSWFIDPAGKYIGLWRCPLRTAIDGLESRVLIERLLVQNFIAMPAPLILHEAAIRVGGLDEDLWYTADWDFWLKLAAAGKTIYVPHALSAFRIHRHSQTAQRSVKVKDFRMQLMLVLEKHIQAYEATHTCKRAVSLAAHFSVNVNTFLASYMHGQKSSLLGLLPQFLAMGPRGCYLFLRDSRIIERMLARLRIRMTYERDSDEQSDS